MGKFQSFVVVYTIPTPKNENEGRREVLKHYWFESVRAIRKLLPRKIETAFKQVICWQNSKKHCKLKVSIFEVGVKTQGVYF